MLNNSRSLPSLNALRAFEAAGRHLSFRAAAQELGVTQGAVAQHIRGLEADLGIKLFERLTRSLALTGPGRSYLTHIRRAFELITDATASLRPVPLRLTISVTPTFASKWLIPRLPEFMAEHPLFDLHILASETLAGFHSDGVDIAVRQGQPPFSPSLMADLLFPQQVVAVCSPTLLANSAYPVTAENLSHFVLLHDTYNLWPEFIEKTLKQPICEIAKNVRFNQTSLALDAAMAGQGLALASHFLVERDLAAGRLVSPFKATLRGPRDFYLLMPRKQRAPGPTATVRDWLLQQRPSITAEH